MRKGWNGRRRDGKKGNREGREGETRKKVGETKKWGKGRPEKEEQG